MAFDFTSTRGQVRLLISDVDEANLVLSDDMLDGFLRLHTGKPSAIRRAAAYALDAIATSEALVSKVIRTAAGASTDGTKVADALRKHAVELRAAADVDDENAAWDDDGAFGVSEFRPYPWRRAAWSD